MTETTHCRPDAPGLRLFLDTADAWIWADWLPLGLFFGVTTNPTLLQRAGVSCTLPVLRDLAARAFDLGAAEIQIQTWGETADSMTTTGQALAAIDPRVVVKVPITRHGVAASTRLIASGARVTLTGVYAAHQALTALAVGADYAAPYLGRMNDAGRDGQATVIAMQEMVDRIGGTTRILVASLRKPEEVVRLARCGVDTFTIAPTLAEGLIDEPLTEAAAGAFEAAAKAMGAVPTTADGNGIPTVDGGATA